MAEHYQTNGPSRAELDAMPGPVVVEFGTDWCGYCRSAQSPIENALRDFPNVARLRIEDGKGRPLGRSFGIKSWPTLVFLADGREVARVVRPDHASDVRRALAELTAMDRSAG